jgi:hypothetical protein
MIWSADELVQNQGLSVSTVRIVCGCFLFVYLFA